MTCLNAFSSLLENNHHRFIAIMNNWDHDCY